MMNLMVTNINMITSSNKKDWLEIHSEFCDHNCSNSVCKDDQEEDGETAEKHAEGNNSRDNKTEFLESKFTCFT